MYTTTALLLRPFWTAFKLVAIDYVKGASFSFVARAISLILAFVALVLALVFVAVLPQDGRLTLGDGLTFVAVLLTAASFFANAGRPSEADAREAADRRHG